MKYLKAEEILVLNARVVEEIGGRQGVRDAHLLLSLVERPKVAFGKKDMYESVFEKAAVYFDSLVHYHVFLEGNKRTALLASARFLHVNGHTLTATNREVERFTLRVAKQKPDTQEIAKWLESHSEKRK